MKLQGFQKKYLKGCVHNQKPIALIGSKGLTDSVLNSIDDALCTHELIKVKFIENKEKEQKIQLLEEIEKRLGCEQVGMIGHIAIIFRQNKDIKKQKIKLPQR